MDENYKEPDLSKVVKQLMDEEGYEFGEAVKEAMAQGYKDGGLMVAIQRFNQGGNVIDSRATVEDMAKSILTSSAANDNQKLQLLMDYDNAYNSKAVRNTQNNTGGQLGQKPPLFNNSNQTAMEKLLGLQTNPNFQYNSPLAPMLTMPPTRSTGFRQGPGYFGNEGIMINGKRYMSEDEAIDDMGVETYNRFMADGGMAGGKTYHQFHDQYVPMDEESMGYAYGGGVGSMMQPRMNFAGGGGDFEPLGYQDESIAVEDLTVPSRVGDFAITAANALDNQTGLINSAPSIMNQGVNTIEGSLIDGDDPSSRYGVQQDFKSDRPFDRDFSSFDEARMGNSNQIPDRNRGQIIERTPSAAFNRGFTMADVANTATGPFDRDFSSFDQARMGTPSTESYGRPSMADIAGLSLPSDNVMSVEEIEEQIAANKNKFGLSSLLDFAPFGKKSISGMALRGIGNLFQNIAPRSYGYSTRTYNAMTPGQQALADGLYQPGGLLSGYNKISAFGRGPLGTLSNRLSTIQKTLAKQKVPSKVLQQREQEIKDAINESINTGEREALGDPGRSVDHGITGGPTRTDIDVADGGAEAGCFIKGTLITMADGTKKPVEQVDLGDEVAVGGKVFAVGRFLNTELYDYKGIKVSGSHMVNEEGDWMRVRDTKHGKSLGNDENTVYVFGSENRRILINDILFTDYFEIEDQEQLLKEEDKFFDNWKTFANDQDKKNVNTLNAS